MSCWIALVVSALMMPFSAFSEDAAQEYSLDTALYFAGPNVLGYGLYVEEAPDFHSLRAAQIQGAFGTYEEFVEYLKMAYPSFYDRAVLVVASQSLQFSDIAHPRRIMYGGGKVLTLGHAFGAGRTVEIMETGPGKEFEFKEILFTKNGVEFNEKPQSCLACHGSPARPIWEPYDFWPTALFSFASTTSSPEEKELIKNSPEAATVHSRNSDRFADYIYKLRLEKWAQSEIPVELKKKKVFHAALGSLANCESEAFAVKFAPPSFAAEFDAQLRKRQEYGRNALFAFQSLLDLQYEGVYGLKSNRIVFPEKEQLKLGYYARFGWALNQVGAEISDLVLSHSGNEEVTFIPALFGLDLITMLYMNRPELFDGLTITPTPIFGTNGKIWYAPDCDQLARLSQEDLEGFNAKPLRLDSLNRVSERRTPISRCIKCHSLPDQLYSPDLGLAPYIPFDKPRELANRLKTSALGASIQNRISRRDSKQMPPGVPLTEEEARAVDAMLGRLAE